MEILTTLALIISGLSLIISVMSWRKSRTIYGFERYPLRMPHGGKIDESIAAVDQEINEQLKSGKWTIVDIVHRKADDDYDIILGKIKE